MHGYATKNASNYFIHVTCTFKAYQSTSERWLVGGVPVINKSFSVVNDGVYLVRIALYIFSGCLINCF